MRIRPNRTLASLAAGLALLSPRFAAATITPRYAHTATLISNGNLLVAGGVAGGAVTNSVELIATGETVGGGSSDIAVASMNVARSSHTATFLPNGDVLVAGGIGSGGTALNSLEIYDPTANTWTTLGATLSNARYNHTATLLQDGRVLICGGQDQTGNVWASCDAYNSATGVLATGVATLNQARALHTAVLLKDGRVWFAGGWNPAPGNAATNYYLPTTELFDPASNTVASSAYLLEARAYHSATVMGDGRVTVTGGYNGVDYGSKTDPTDPLHNYGLLDEMEIYDPANDTVSAGLTTNFRRMMHSATLLADGTLNLYGGLGNVGPQNIETALTATSGQLYLAPGNSSSLVLTNNGQPAIALQLPVAASGTIVDGELDWVGSGNTQNGKITFSSGTAAVTIAPVSLNGLTVSCHNGQCGILVLPNNLPVNTITTQFTPSKAPYTSPVDMSQYNGTFTSSATIIIREMLLASVETYSQASAVVSITSQAQIGRAQQTATLTTSGDVYYVGGLGAGGALGFDDALVLQSSNFNTISATMNTPVAYHTATMLPDNTILVAGGESAPNTPLATAQIYSPALGTFTPTTSPMSLSRSNHTATLLTNGRVLIAGGFTNQTSTQPTNVAEIYYPNTRIFSVTAPMAYPRAAHTATLMPDGSVIVLGGQTTAGNYLSAAEVYSSTSAVWTTLTPIPTGLSEHTATLLKDGRILVIGGQTSSGPSGQTYAYTPVTNSWATLAPMPSSLYDHSATMMFDGRVLVAGGNDGTGSQKKAYLYDPGGNSWSLAGKLTQGRSAHTATLLPNNTVMVTGGFGNPTPNEVEIYHLDGSTWAPVGQIQRVAHTITLTTSGKLLGIGGFSGSTFFNSAVSGDFSLAPDADTTGAPPSLRQSSITAITAYPFAPGSNFNVTGTEFEGGTEASGGGAAAMNSSFSYPHLLLQQFGGSGGSSSQSDPGFAVDLTTQVYLNPANRTTLNTSLTVPTPATAALPYGWYQARVGANDVYSKGLVFQVGPALPAAAPASITGFAMGTSSISWSWSSVAGPIGGYDVYQASSSVFIGTVPVSGSPSIIQTGLQPNTTGSIAVAAYTLSGDGPLLFSGTFYTRAAPPTLVQLSSVTPNSVLVQWNTSSNAPGTIYEISQSTDNFVNSVSTPVPASLFVTTNSYTIASLSPATMYYFRMRAFNSQGIPSNFSATVATVTTSGVGGVVGVALTPTSIQWSWGTTPGATSYDVFVTTTGQLLGTSTSTIFTDTGLGVDTPRNVRVGAVTSAGLGPLTPSATVYTLANPPGPSYPDYISLSTGGFVVNWYSNGNPPALTYDVNVYTVGSATSSLVVSTITTTNQFAAVSHMSPSQYAQVDVYALNGNGVPSTPYILNSTYTFAAAPTTLAILANTANAITVGWNTNGNSTTTFYQLTYSTDNFVANVTTAVPFALGENLSSSTISGLVTSTTYWIVVQAENKLGQLSSFSNTVTTITFNGGAPPGLLQGILPAATTGQISGTLGNGQFISLASQSGSFPTNTLVTISSYNVAATLCPGAVNMGVSINDTPAYMPLRAILLTLGGFTVSPSSPTLTSTVTLLRYVPSSGVCVPLNTTFNVLAQTLTAEINDFGIFVLAAPPTFGSAATARAYPNPYHVNRDGYVTIDQIPPGSRVRVMDLRGDTVLDQAADAAGLVTWSATNGAGRNVASGLYLVIIEGGGTKKILKLAVIR